jgi:hypothetical protein
MIQNMTVNIYSALEVEEFGIIHTNALGDLVVACL